VNPLFDTHCHLYADHFEEDLDAVIERAIQNNVKKILVPGENYATSLQSINLCAKYENLDLYAAVGIHPHYAKQGKTEFNKLRLLVDSKVVAAIGEIGLDYYRMLSEKEAQIEIFRHCLELALELEKPIILHNRDATDDSLSILNDWIRQIPTQSRLKSHPGVFHSFNGDSQILDFALKYHFYLGIGGPITFRNAEQLRLIIKNIPLEQLLLETDSPYLSPHPNRGKRNEPANVRLVADKLSEVLEIPVEKMIDQTTANGMEFFDANIK
jgi:TatD DNase family protein